MSYTHFLILIGTAILIAALQLVHCCASPASSSTRAARASAAGAAGAGDPHEGGENDDASPDGMANQLQGLHAGDQPEPGDGAPDGRREAGAGGQRVTHRPHELLAAFAAFEAQLAQRLAAPDAAQSLALSSFRTELTAMLGAMSGVLKVELEGNGNQIQRVHGAAGVLVAAARFPGAEHRRN